MGRERNWNSTVLWNFIAHSQWHTSWSCPNSPTNQEPSIYISLWRPFSFKQHTDNFSLPTVSGQLNFHLEIRSCHSDKRVAAFIPCCFRSIGRSKWKDGSFNFHFCSILIVVSVKYSFFWNQDLRPERAWSHRSISLRVTGKLVPLQFLHSQSKSKWPFSKHWLRTHCLSS